MAEASDQTTGPRVTAASRMARNLRIYVAAVGCAGAIVVGQSILALPKTPQPLVWLLFACFGFLAGTFTMKIASVRAIVSVTDTFFITAAVMFGPAPATVAAAVDAFIVSFRRRNAWSRIAFNTAQTSMSLWAAGQVFFFVARVSPLAVSSAPIGRLIAPLLALTATYFLLNSGLTAIAVGLDTRHPVTHVWRSHFLWLSLGFLAAGSVAFCLILLIQQVSLAATAMVLPLIIVFHLTLRSSFGRLEDAHNHLASMDRLYLSTIETLAMAIDAKDDVTHSHVRRVETYAVSLAKALGITDELMLKAIKAASLLHDTGKLAVPEHILNKPGGLTPSEFEQMKRHVDVGADILSLVDFPYPVVPIVRCHHESWDGSGYPRGIRGEDIPIGARILSVVDCYDALTSDRPYRAALSDEAALDILRKRRGTMYDPRVVDTFIAIHLDIEMAEADRPEHRKVLEQIGRSRDPLPARPVAAPPAPAAQASDEMLAFVSLARLASGEITVADVLSLASKLTRDVVPGVTAAWYLLDPGTTRLSVADASGPAASLVRGETVPMGERITGWVGATRQVIVNSDAALDLGERARSIAPPLESCMSAPLVSGDALVGALTLYAHGRNAFTEDHGRLVQMIAPHVAQAVARAQRRQPAEVVPIARDFKVISSR